MKTLQEISLLKATRNLNSLRDLINFCAGNQTFQDSCIVSENFWKESLIRIMGNPIVVQRGDLEGAETWYEFVRSLAVGLTFKYRMTNDAFNDIWTTKPEPWYLDENTVEVDDIDHYPIEIPAMLPTPGSKGYFVRFTIDGDWSREENNFFLHPDNNIAFENAVKFVGESYHHIMSSRIDSEVKISLDFDLDRIMDQRHNDKHPSQPLPPAEFFTNIVRQGTQPIMLTYGNNLKHKSRKFIYTETYWDIQPISF